MATHRYDYASFPTAEKARDALESMFAAGEVSSGEHPEIEFRRGKTASWSKGHPRFVITLEEGF